MVSSQFSIKILGVHFGNFVLDNSNWDKASHSLAKEINIWKSATHFEIKKRIVNQILLSKLRYIYFDIFYSKIYHEGTWKNNSSTPYLVMWQGIIYKKSASGSRTLHCLLIFFQSPILIWKFQKRSLNRGTLVPAPAIYQTKGPFSVFRTFPYDLDYSLCGAGILDIDTQLNSLEIKWI